MEEIKAASPFALHSLWLVLFTDLSHSAWLAFFNRAGQLTLVLPSPLLADVL